MKKKKKEVFKKHPRIRDLRNIALLSIATIAATQAITNASLIKVMASNWVFGIQQSITPQKTLQIGQKSSNNGFASNDIKKLIASNKNIHYSRKNIVPTIEQKLSQKQQSYKFTYNTLPPINKVTIGSLGVDAPIVSVFVKNSADVMEGDFNQELKNGTAIYPGTAIPGTKGHSLIFGHSSQERRKGNKYDTVFSPIGKLKPGDIFTITREGKLLSYRVKEQKVTAPDKVIDIYNKRNNKESNHLSLITCRPLGSSKKRMVVTSELINNTQEAHTLLSYQTQ